MKATFVKAILQAAGAIVGKFILVDSGGKEVTEDGAIKAKLTPGEEIIGKVGMVDPEGEPISQWPVRGQVKSVTKGWQDNAGSDEGGAHVVNKPVLKTYTTTGAAAISKQTSLRADYPGRSWILKRITVTFSTAPTTSENLTVTQNPSKRIPDRPSTVLFSINPGTNSLTSLVQEWDGGGQRHEYDDEVTLAYTNTDTRTVTAEIVVEVL